MFKKIYEKYFRKYNDREDMPEDVKKELVNDLFASCEEDGFNQTFYSPYYKLSKNVPVKKYNNKPFTVVRRAKEEEINIDFLPAWKIRFENGYEAFAYPEEICK